MGRFNEGHFVNTPTESMDRLLTPVLSRFNLFFWRPEVDSRRLKSCWTPGPAPPPALDPPTRRPCRYNHGQLTIKIPKQNVVIWKNWPAKGLCDRCWSEFINRLEIHSVMMVFSSQLCELLPPLTLSLVHLPHPSPPPPFTESKYKIYRQCVARREGVEGGCWVLLETIFCRCLTLGFWPDSEPTQLLLHPKLKT